MGRDPVARLPYPAVWALDFEYRHPDGHPLPEHVRCMVARDLKGGRELRLWADELPARPAVRRRPRPVRRLRGRRRVVLLPEARLAAAGARDRSAVRVPGSAQRRAQGPAGPAGEPPGRAAALRPAGDRREAGDARAGHAHRPERGVHRRGAGGPARLLRRGRARPGAAPAADAAGAAPRRGGLARPLLVRSGGDREQRRPARRRAGALDQRQPRSDQAPGHRRPGPLGLLPLPEGHDRRPPPRARADHQATARVQRGVRAVVRHGRVRGLAGGPRDRAGALPQDRQPDTEPARRSKSTKTCTRKWRQRSACATL